MKNLKNRSILIRWIHNNQVNILKEVNKLKLTVIGCWGGYPKVNQASTGYLLEHDGFKLLIDCGSAVLSKLQNYIQPQDIDACIITHYHADHIADIGVLQHALLIQKYLSNFSNTLPIYGHNLDKESFTTLTYKDITKGESYNPSERLELGPFSISFIQTKHPVPCFALRIEAGGKTLVFTADSAYKPEFVNFANKSDLLLCECNFYADMSGENAGHMNSRDAGNLAAQAEVKQLILTHLPHYGELNKLVEEAGQYYNGPIQLAEEGQVFQI